MTRGCSRRRLEADKGGEARRSWGRYITRRLPARSGTGWSFFREAAVCPRKARHRTCAGRPKQRRTDPAAHPVRRDLDLLRCLPQHGFIVWLEAYAPYTSATVSVEKSFYSSLQASIRYKHPHHSLPNMQIQASQHRYCTSIDAFICVDQRSSTGTRLTTPE